MAFVKYPSQIYASQQSVTEFIAMILWLWYNIVVFLKSDLDVPHTGLRILTLHYKPDASLLIIQVRLKKHNKAWPNWLQLFLWIWYEIVVLLKSDLGDPQTDI
jgi:hypothetical protein